MAAAGKRSDFESQWRCCPRCSHQQRRLLAAAVLWTIELNHLATTTWRLKAFSGRTAFPRKRYAAHLVRDDASRWCARRGGEEGQQVLQAATANDAASSQMDDALSVLSDEWQPEAARCWGSGARTVSERATGWIAQMFPTGSTEYATFLCERPAEQRLWKGSRDLTEEVSRTFSRIRSSFRGALGSMAATVTDRGSVREQDYDRAMRIFGRGASNSPPGRVALDVGCGDAYFGRRFVQSGAFDEVYALDISWPALSWARDEAEDADFSSTDLRLVQGDAEALPFREGTISCAMWSMGMHATKNPLAVLRSIYRSLHPNGGVLVATGFKRIHGVASVADLESLTKSAGFTDAAATEEGPRYVLVASRN